MKLVSNWGPKANVVYPVAEGESCFVAGFVMMMIMLKRHDLVSGYIGNFQL